MISSGSLVWVPDDKECYVPCRVGTAFKRGDAVGNLEPVASATLSSSSSKISIDGKRSKNVLVMDEESLTLVDNMVQLKELNEACILHNLRARFLEDHIYTNVGTILVAVNPFKQLRIYTPEVLDNYRNRGGRTSKPHVFGVADNAYRELVSTGKDQSCVISGESGAGKTETTKLFLQYLTEVSGTVDPTDGHSGGLQEQILQANPLMEAFGNAKTVRNDNSSRFGKWISIKFDTQKGTMTGGTITSYLLEKSRLVHQSEAERNYHVFYQLCAGVSKDKSLLRKLKLQDADQYHYLNQSGKTVVEGISDEAGWEKMQHAMNVMQIPHQDQVLNILAGILHLGNVSFGQRENSGDGEAFVYNKSALEICSSLLGVNAEGLERVLTSKSVGVRSVIIKPYNSTEAQEARDALAKAIYGQLFEWLILHINICLDSQSLTSTSATMCIGVLDIFGFESFEMNSFEQLCINYCNEKLQFHFNRHIFQLEQEEYAKESIDVSNISFTDNQDCVTTLERKSTGIFSMIDEEINIPRGSDTGFLNKVLQLKSDVVKRAPKHASCFVVHHYAGPVSYNVSGFLEKNKDMLHPDLQATMQISSIPLLSELFQYYGEMNGTSSISSGRSSNSSGRSSGSSASSRGGSRSKRKTLGSKFKDQLQALMLTLNATEPHFVRCIKPNSDKVGNLFTSTMVLSQLRYAGLLQVCKIRQVGYPIRHPFDTFLHRYGPIARSLEQSYNNDIGRLCELLSKNNVLVEGDYKMGKTKVFMRNEQHSILESHRENSLRSLAAVVQGFFRVILARNQVKEYKSLLIELDKATSLSELDLAIRNCSDIPNQNASMLVKARLRLGKLQEEERVTKLLRDALGSLDVNALNIALSAAGKIELEGDVVAEARDALTRVKLAKQMRLELEEAITKRDLDQLVGLLDKAMNELGLTPEQDDKVLQATKLKTRLEGEVQLANELEQALSGCSEVERFETLIDRANELALSCAALGQCREVLESLMSLRKAAAARDYVTFKKSLEALPNQRNVPEKSADLLLDLEKEHQLKALINDPSASVQALQSALMSLPQTSSVTLMEQGRQALDKCVLREKLCCEKRPEKLQELVTKAADLGLERKSCAELDQAYQVLEQADESSRLFSKLNVLVSSRTDVTGLKQFIKENEGSGNTEVVERAKAELKTMEDDVHLINLLSICTTLQQVQAVCMDSNSRLVSDCLTLAFSIEEAAQNDNETPESLAKLKEKAIAHHLPGMVKLLESSLGRLETRQVLESKMEVIISTDSNIDQIKDLLLEYERLFPSGDDHQIVLKCRSRVERDRKMKTLLKDLDAAIEKKDYDALNSCQALVLESGIELPEEKMEEVKQLSAKLAQDRENCSKIVAEMKVLQSKATTSRNGITEEDLVPLSDALKSYSSDGMDETVLDIVKAKESLARMEHQIEVQKKLVESSNGNFDVLKRALEMGQECNLDHLDSFVKVRTLLRSKEQEHRSQQRTAFEEESCDKPPVPPRSEKAKVKMTARQDESNADSEEEEDPTAQANLERRNRAKNVRYEFTRYHRIRSDESFVKGMLFLHKSRAKRDKLTYQTYVINKSVLDISSGKVKEAIRIHKSILGYCGEKSMSFPATLAQDILSKAVKDSELADETYVQLCKHLTNNTKSVGRGWHLMCLCVGTFPPSSDFEPYLFNFLQLFTESPDLIGCYATFALRRLEGMLETGPTGFVPSVEEIEAYTARPPILAEISLVDGTVLTEDLPVSPDLDVAKVNEICSHFLGLEDERVSDTFGVCLNGKIPLRGSDFLGDEFVKAKCDVTFVFKRKVVLKLNGKDAPSTDEMYNRLVYLQAQKEFMEGRFAEDLLQSDMEELIALSVAVDFGEKLPDDLDLAEFTPPACSTSDIVLETYKKLSKRNPESLQADFVSKVQNLPRFGRILFETEEGELGVDSDGIHVKEKTYGFPQLYRWGGTATLFTMVVFAANEKDTERKEEISFHTKDGMYIGGCLLDHVNFIMDHL